MRFPEAQSEFPIIRQAMESLYPVGSIYASINPADPATYLGFGAWTAFGTGRIPIGVDASDPDFDTAGKTGGAKSIALSESELPSHSHSVTDPGHAHLTQRYPTATGGSSGFTIDTSMSGTPAVNTLPTASATTGISIGNTGSGQAHNNMPPFIAIHMWQRTA